MKRRKLKEILKEATPFRYVEMIDEDKVDLGLLILMELSISLKLNLVTELIVCNKKFFVFYRLISAMSTSIYLDVL